MAAAELCGVIIGRCSKLVFSQQNYDLASGAFESELVLPRGGRMHQALYLRVEHFKLTISSREVFKPNVLRTMPIKIILNYLKIYSN